MKKKINYFKIVALILLLIEIGIAILTDRQILKSNLNIWRLYVACVMFIPINVMFIGTKRKVNK